MSAPAPTVPHAGPPAPSPAAPRRPSRLARARILLRLALRNVRRNARRSALTAAAMVVGLALLVISRALADGMHEAWIEQGVRLGSGHLSIQAPGFAETGSLADRLGPGAQAAARAALSQDSVAPYVSLVSPRLEVGGLASSTGSSLPVRIVGVDPATEARFTPLAEEPVEGRYLTPDDRLGAYIGDGLAERLGIHLGSRFVLTAQGPSSELAGQMARVVGIFHTGVPEVDQAIVQIPLATARSWLGLPSGVTSIAVLLHSVRDLEGVLPRVRSALAAREDVRALSWRQASPELDSAVRVDDYGDYVFHAILFAIIALAILNAVLMSVLNRTRELGVLEALGLTPRETGTLVFTEGLLLTLFSGLVGMALGMGIVWVFWRDGLDLSVFYDQSLSFSGVLFDPVVIPRFHVSQVLNSLAWIVGIGVLASLYPARQATRIDIANAMKFER